MARKKRTKQPQVVHVWVAVNEKTGLVADTGGPPAIAMTFNECGAGLGDYEWPYRATLVIGEAGLDADGWGDGE